MMYKHVFVDDGGVYSLLVAANDTILKIPVDISQTEHKLGQPTAFISGKGME